MERHLCYVAFVTANPPPQTSDGLAQVSGMTLPSLNLYSNLQTTAISKQSLTRSVSDWPRMRPIRFFNPISVSVILTQQDKML